MRKQKRMQAHCLKTYHDAYLSSVKLLFVFKSTTQAELFPRAEKSVLNS